MYRKILLAYDGSTFCNVVLQQGAELASLCGAELHLLGIVVTSGVMGIAESVAPGNVWGQEQQNLQQVVESAAQDLQNRGLTVISSLRYGDPAAEIAGYVHDIDADLVVLGHTSKGTLTRWFQGSVGVKLLDHLPCNLLVVTGRKL